MIEKIARRHRCNLFKSARGLSDIPGKEVVAERVQLLSTQAGENFLFEDHAGAYTLSSEGASMA